MNVIQSTVNRLYRANAKGGLWAILAFTLLLGLMEWLVTNRSAMLYLYYVPVILGALLLRRNDAVIVAFVACAVVLNYVFFAPGKLDYPIKSILLWGQLVVWGGTLVLTAYLVSTFKARMHEAMSHRRQAYTGALTILSRLVQGVSGDTEAHAACVAAWAVRIGQELGLGESQVEELRIAGLLHDLHKADASVALLRNAAGLAENEPPDARGHAGHGANAEDDLQGMMLRIADAIETHHEHYDGTGPRKMKGEEIPLLSRLVAVADAFDTLVSDRPPEKGLPIPDALAAMASRGAAHFDPSALAALKRTIAHEGDLDDIRVLGGCAVRG
jgi:K+-sensing histidine kinase KdpD